MINVLITGVGSTLGYGILKTLKKIDYKINIFGTDYLKTAIGLFDVKKGFILPDILKNNISDKLWLDEIIKISVENKIEIIFIGLDFEVPVFSKYKSLIENKSNAKVIVSDIKLVEMCNDKWKTYCFLKENRFLVPESCLPKDINEFSKNIHFPWIIKPRIGSTSKSIFKVYNKEETRQALKNCKKPIIQKYIGSDETEYTCGVICFNKEIQSCISLRRKLKNGNTHIAINEKNDDLNDYVSSVTRFLSPYGPINIQLRKSKRGYEIFEINPRFSGSTYIREKFGVNELSIILNKIFKLKLNENNNNQKYGLVLRYFEEKFISKNESEKFNL